MDRTAPLPRARHPRQKPATQPRRCHTRNRGGDHHRHHRIRFQPRSRGDRIKHHIRRRDRREPTADDDLDEFAEVALATLLIWLLTYLERTISRPLTEKRTRRGIRRKKNPVSPGPPDNN